MTDREKYVEAKFQVYASPRLDALYLANDQIMSIFYQHPALMRIAVGSMICLAIVFMSCGVKTSSNDWCKIVIFVMIIITAFLIPSVFPFLQIAKSI